MKKVACKINMDVETKLTTDKLYDVVEDIGENYIVIDDTGDDNAYYKWRFIEIDLFRDKQLEKLNIKDDC